MNWFLVRWCDFSCLDGALISLVGSCDKGALSAAADTADPEQEIKQSTTKKYGEPVFVAMVAYGLVASTNILKNNTQHIQVGI